ncbi:putative F420-0 ABC transporter substrate-binding protein [Arthrobacter jiangjiafuii]|uniref:F420-0 ABC transporter substrate-binding protein n=1 Tax=Arthrobacter jiangjiafuii TaxID=2817475 RepID=A0A975R0X3_9MICC|nr:putative F420-0 ABC transporter substrate-binding protein [Arthrobacter jiangjiafuii]MBP3045003.1 putative F420-0 ABC transporter substrate-binding protein [Arthrobacter jiangjiafuii]QWC10667.1 putative F420-0 ABC transporter substrate-binding protein [Arthrobacter jiangjiafuii]
MNRSLFPAVSLLLAAMAAGLAGCSAASAPAAPGSPAGSGSTTTPPASATAGGSSGSGGAGSTGYPLTVMNCGTEVTLSAPPERIVAIKSTAVETLLALGLGSKVAGAAFLDGPLPAALAADAPPLNILSDSAPSQEPVLDLEPDFIYAGWESNLSADTAGERDFLASLGIGSYVSPHACRETGKPVQKLDFEDVFAGITEAGAVFGASEAAAKLVAQQRATVEGIEPAGGGRTAFWFSSGRDTPYAGAGLGAPQMMMDTLGLQNITADVQDSWASLSWETVVAANPDVIILVDADRNTAESKKELLASHPATAGMDAVVNNRYLVLPFAAAEAGVRNAEAVADLAEQLAVLP